MSVATSILEKSWNVSEYGKREDFGVNDFAPLIINGERVADVPVRDLLP